MELFKNTNFDFLGKKWPFIGLSLVLTAAGFISLAMKGGPSLGIDFRGGAEVKVGFSTEPPVQQIRSALETKIKNPTVQEIRGTAIPAVLIGTEIKDEKELNANRALIEETLTTMFADPSGKLDLNNASSVQLQDKIREPLSQGGAALGEQQLVDLVKGIEDYRTSKSGLVRSYDELASVKGVTPQVIDVLKANTRLGPFTIMSAEVVGPKIGAELTRQAILATLYALGGMLVYIAFRFEWIYGVAAVIAVFHDTLITIGIFSLVNKQISLTVVAALLTLVGYSMNDTIVVFDRIRENLKIVRREKLDTIINLSVNQTLSRTVLTSGLTLLTALSLWIFGGEVLNGFAFALVMGIIVGTYSSVFIASPILVFWQDFIDSRKSARPASGGGGTSSGSGSSPVTKPAPGAKPGGPRAVTAAPNKETAGTRKAVRG